MHRVFHVVLLLCLSIPDCVLDRVSCLVCIKPDALLLLRRFWRTKRFIILHEPHFCRNKKRGCALFHKLVSISSRITCSWQTVVSTARMTPYAFLVADNTPSVTFTFAVFVPACQAHVFTWQLSFLFRAYLVTVPTNMVAYMWNTDRKAVIIRILGALEVAAAPPESAMQATRRCDGLSQRRYLHT